MEKRPTLIERGSASILVLVLFALAAAPDAPAKDGDWQQWTEVSYTQKLDDSFDAQLRYEQRIEEDVSKFALTIIEPILTWHQSKTWDFNITYRRIERYEPVQSAQDEPTTAAILKIPLDDKWKLSNRFRCQFVIPEDSGRDWHMIYRNRTELKTVWEVEEVTLEPFLADEWFFNTATGDIDQNRLMIGMGFPITENFTTKVYFMRRDQKTSQGWEWHPVAGVQLQVKY